MSSKTKTTATKEEAAPALVPKLRFPEFRNAPGWELMTLGEITTKTDKRNKGGKSYPVYSINNKAGFTPQGEQFTGVDSEKRGYDLSLYKVIERNTFAYNPARINVGSIGYSGDLNNVIISSLYVCFQTKPGVDDRFLMQFFGTRDFEGSVNNNVEGGIRSYLFYETFSIIKLFLPAFREQQKIADCLSSVDELIAAQARKLDALKTHKKGLMQQLFPREGETQPRLRFPEFQNAGEWVEQPLGQLIEVASGQVDPKQPPYCDSPQIGSENIESHSGKLVNVKSAGDKGVISGNYAFDENDILYSKIRPALNKVAAPAFKGICSADIYPIRPADGSLLRSYLFYLLLSQEFLDYAIRNSERGKIPKINRDALVTYKALIPSPDEQQRIADCLTSLDDLIAAQTQKHEALKTHKKGLMQQLFPSPEEPTNL
jgi:type I restriction enzyme S subunit